MEQIEDLTLIKSLGKGSFGEVFLSSKKNKSKYFATKKIPRETADNPTLQKYFKNEIAILNSLNHRNIAKLEEVKATKNFYYITMEYINGKALSVCLKKYMERHKKAFPEEIVQYLMKQIIDAVNYFHKRKIIHRDLKLDNIMVNFDTEQDKINLNMMKAQIKIIDFGVSAILSPGTNNLAYTAVGTVENMDPIILKKYLKKENLNLGYDEKVDIWSIGTICYELLIGKPLFDTQNYGELLRQVESGAYIVPKNVSREVVSFINSMLLKDSKMRLSAGELRKHPFLTNNVSTFTKMETVMATKNSLLLNKNKSIWDIFDKSEIYDNIKSVQTQYLPSISEESARGTNNSSVKSYTDNKLGNFLSNNSETYTDNQLGYYKLKSDSNINFPNNKNNNPGNLHRSATMKNPNINTIAVSFYGQNMHPKVQISQSYVMSPNPGFQSQPQNMQNFGGFYPLNIGNQGYLPRANIIK